MLYLFPKAQHKKRSSTEKPPSSTQSAPLETIVPADNQLHPENSRDRRRTLSPHSEPATVLPSNRKFQRRSSCLSPTLIRSQIGSSLKAYIDSQHSASYTSHVDEESTEDEEEEEGNKRQKPITIRSHQSLQIPAQNSNSVPSRASPVVVRLISEKSSSVEPAPFGRFEDEVTACDILKDFCERTSSHGIPHIGASHSNFGRIFWSTVFVLSLGAFLYQTYFTVAKYLRFDKIVQMELKFEPAPFPAVTVCNLNALKYSKVFNVEDIKETLDIYRYILETKTKRTRPKAQTNISNDTSPTLIINSTAPTLTATLNARNLNLRNISSVMLAALPKLPFKHDSIQKDWPQNSPPAITIYQPTYVKCECIERKEKTDCIPVRDLYEIELNNTCICFQEILSPNIWPCYEEQYWSKAICTECSLSWTCRYPGVSKMRKSEKVGQLDDSNIIYLRTDPTPCLCQNVSYSCVVYPENGQIEWWNPFDYTIYTKTSTTEATTVYTPRPGAVETLNVEGLSDEGAITTRTKETLIYLLNSLPLEVRKNLSYTKEEFIILCSFNSEDCNISRDFELHLDPVFGNCYTFNYNHTTKLVNSRAGYMYGLRLLLNVNQTDYMPITEAAGVRIVVHNQTQHPFPDTFGYSAPTGVVSSFGLKSQYLERLMDPHGKCVKNGKTDRYIYNESYTTEGCLRSCIQMTLCHICECCDARFPAPTGYNICSAEDSIKRSCIRNITDDVSDFYRIQKDCKCMQPCKFVILFYYVIFICAKLWIIRWAEGFRRFWKNVCTLKTNEYIYQVSYSASTWPADNYNSGNCNQVIEHLKENETCIDYYRKHTAFIELYYEQLNYEFLMEVPAYTIVNLLADFGGSVGLWIGFSVITAVEILMLCFQLIAYFLEQNSRRNKISKYRHRRRKLPHHYILHSNKFAYPAAAADDTDGGEVPPSIAVKNPLLSSPRILSQERHVMKESLL